MARFYGIIIKLFFGDHPPPYFHAVYGEFVGLFDIRTLEETIIRKAVLNDLEFEQGANLGAIRAYKKAGFQRHMLEMSVSL